VGVSRDTLERIKLALDPLSIVRDAVPSLKQSGARWKGNCPFHNERSPSFFFQPDKGLWHCFGACQEGGDIITFVMKLEGLSFPEALRELARRAGIPLEWDKVDDASSRRAKERDQLLSLLDQASGFYRDALRRGADAESARRHLAQRGIRPETVDRFQLGFAPRRDSFLDAALKKGVPIELLLKAGLAARSDRTGRYQDPLGGRLIFPIRDPYGQPVAFGGRVLDDDAGPKYINSADTPVYTKGRQLYGLYEGRTELRARGQAVIVEGYMDVVGLHQAGAAVAVAPLGTALTADQARLLRRYVQEAVLLFDPDPAGQNASWRSAGVFLKEDLFVRVAQVPDGKDPDEFVLAQGIEALDRLLAGAHDVVDYWLDTLAPSMGGFSDLHGRLRRAEELIRFIGAVPNELLREEWVRRAAGRLVVGLRCSSSGNGAPGRIRGRSRRVRAGSGTPRSRWRTRAHRRGRSVANFGRRRRSVGNGGFLRSVVFRHALFGRVSPLARAMEGSRHGGPRRRRGSVGAADAPWLTALLLEGKTFPDSAEALARHVKSLEASALGRERTALQKDVLDMLDGRRDRDDAKILRYQNLTRLLRASAPAAAGPSDR
jgi:DNA primase